MKRGVAWLVVVLPLLSLAVGALLYYLASQHPDPSLVPVETPLSKTSWREEQ